MNKEQKILAEAYQAVLEANPIQQQMRDMMQQKMQQRIQSKATAQTQQQTPQKAANFDGKTGLPLTAQGVEAFKKLPPNQQQTILNQNGFNTLEDYTKTNNLTPNQQQTSQQQAAPVQQSQSKQWPPGGRSPSSILDDMDAEDEAKRKKYEDRIEMLKRMGDEQRTQQPSYAQPTQTPQQPQQTTPAPAQQQPQNTQQIQQGMAELGKQLTQFQQRFNEIMKSLGGTQPQQAAPTNQNQGWQKTGAAKMTKKY